MGYQHISVLDISAAAIERAKDRLGERAIKVTWIVADASSFIPTEKYDFWHDRAAFHFLTDDRDIANYLETDFKSINPLGFLVQYCPKRFQEVLKLPFLLFFSVYFFPFSK
ncbi:class I SAM-dependent methyltransferase [Arenibacter lacus]|uniref:class I SAM-dependent methyltransferase n=1 Tax=Arenibacter lacus TaxID=2608629 RepID=UPI0021D1B6DE|nr:class I SAM-dependent methyltransferase [Arenibacter lacus]